jgi:periplasmic protein TonB
VVTTSALVRVACALVSTGVHVLAFVAAGHPTRSSIREQNDGVAPVVVDVAADSLPEPADPQATLAGARKSAPVPPLTHPYPVRAGDEAHPHDPAIVHEPLPVPAPSEALAAIAPAPPRFVVTVTNRAAEPTAASAASTSGVQAETTGEPLSERSVSAPARLATPVTPAYPVEARAQEIEADVVMSIVVAPSGRVVEAGVVKAAGSGFDEEALRAVRSARFIAARLDGRPVAVRMRWSVSFRLH